MLIQLIYTSKATGELSDGQLAAILKVSVGNNQLHGITGLLLYSHGTFMQLLEGEASDVDATFERIKADPNHHSIEAHLRTPIKAREFGQWYMGYRAIRPEDSKAFPNYAPFFEDGFNSNLLATNPGDCLTIMKALAGLPE
jgi:hypothetical protein